MGMRLGGLRNKSFLELRTLNFELRRRVLVATMLFVGGCGGDFANLFESLGGDVVGDRGRIQALFLNNTPYRAVLTFGTYDQTDPTFVPDVRQFALDDADLELGPDGASGIGSLDCARVFSVGGARMLALIAANGDPADVTAAALVEGVEFYEIPEDDNTNDNTTPDAMLRGRAAPFEALLGVDFPCNAFLILRLEQNPPGPNPFRVDFQIIASRTTR